MLSHSDMAMSESIPVKENVPADGPTAGIYLTAISGVVFIFSQVLAAVGAVMLAFVDIKSIPVQVWIALAIIFVPASIWVIARATKMAIRAEILSNTGPE